MELYQSKYSTISEHGAQSTEYRVQNTDSKLRTQNSHPGTRKQLGAYKVPTKASLFRSYLPFSLDDPLVRAKFLQCHGTTGMHFLRTDTDFGSQTELCPIRKGC